MITVNRSRNNCSEKVLQPMKHVFNPLAQSGNANHNPTFAGPLKNDWTYTGALLATLKGCTSCTLIRMAISIKQKISNVMAWLGIMGLLYSSMPMERARRGRTPESG